MSKRFILCETTYFGAGCRGELTGEISRRKLKKALIVTDMELIKHGITDKVLDSIGATPYAVFSAVKANPTVNNVKEGLETFKKIKADFIIAVGGGSVIDAAKAIAIIAANPEYSDVISLAGVVSTKNRCIPIIALPTTAGTAAEVTINYVITDEARQVKMVCVDPNALPILSIIDAELMITMPKDLTAATGVDALTHAIEGYITKGAWEMSDMFELKAIELIAQSLREAANNSSDIVAREKMALAQYIAGMGFSNVGLGAVHSMAHPLGGHFDIAHGVANALLLPVVMEFNLPACEQKYAKIAVAMGQKIDGLNAKDAAVMAVSAVKKLSIDLGIPQTLHEIGVSKSDLPKLAKDAYNDICTGGNPRDITEKDILTLYKKAY